MWVICLVRGSSYLDNAGYPLAFELWDLVKSKIADPQVRANIQAKLDTGASGLEDALDLLDDGGANETPYRHMVTEAIANLFLPKKPNLDLHVKFVQRLSQRADPSVKVFSLNYDPLVERSAEVARVRILDGFLGMEHAYFAPEVFAERVGQIRGSHKGRQFDETVKPIHLLKLHGSLGWYECPHRGVRRCAFGSTLPKWHKTAHGAATAKKSNRHHASTICSTMVSISRLLGPRWYSTQSLGLLWLRF